eukprot:CAMPEP_0170787108 /NCGR_PEP_ID=MMETSP0733-20121128/18100_1 /TAXON_ID=186038 /ORGANISM="Fragilariopsis kerguelensis, Strain L26-C5" /LENGTH=185 /DNA_ID=CAMNT_0011133279 /DNA_START=69 /DNA_END=626 /DNA_ORIENTATION=-
MNFFTVTICAALAVTSKFAAAENTDRVLKSKRSKHSKSQKGLSKSNLQGWYKAVDVEDGSLLSFTITGPEEGGLYKVNLQDSAWGLCANDGSTEDNNPFDLGILFGEGTVNYDNVLVIKTPTLFCGVKSGVADKVVDFGTYFGDPFDLKFTIKDGYLEDNFELTTIDGVNVKLFGGNKFFKVSMF